MVETTGRPVTAVAIAVAAAEGAALALVAVVPVVFFTPPEPLGRPRGRPEGTGLGFRSDGSFGGRPRPRLAGTGEPSLAGVVAGLVGAIVCVGFWGLVG